MLEKTVQCPKCGKIIISTGNPGEVVSITCPSCGMKGKVTFKKLIAKEESAIEVSNLKKVYSDLIAVNDISFSVKKGEVFAFLGPNGAGKTTTVEMIESIRLPTAGSIKILGKDINTSFNDVKEKIGILPQEFHSFERLTVRETLIYFSKLYDKRADIDKIIQLMDLTSFKNMLYKNLSGGLKQRVGVAIALVNDPEIIFLDEPTTGLDPKARREVWNVIAGLKKQGKTIFLTTHYMEEAEYLADHIAIIHQGKIIAEGTLDELISKYGSGATLFIKRCKDENAFEMLREKGYNVVREGNGNISIKIDYNDRVFEILSNLRYDCIEYESIDIRQSNLEEVFLNLTGAKLLEEET
jgi:ABC-2 type transport system ATP-binding protein